MAENLNNGIKQRISIIQVLIVVCILLLGAKSFDIQVFKAKVLSQKAENDYSKHITIKGARGQILDRSMNKLATSTDAISISACPSKIDNPKFIATQLSGVLKLNKHKLEAKLSSDRMFAWIAKRVSPEQANQIRKMKLNGIYFENDSKRFYPYRELGAQVIGFTGSENNGLEGLEFKYNTILEGEQLNVKLKQDGNGRIFDLDEKRKFHLRGKSIVLTLDKKIQFLSEQTLEKTVRNHRANSGMALVMRPKTGELLAIAHYPKFNPNDFSGYEKNVFRNRAVTDAFEPGSALKVLTAAAALEKGFTPKSIFFCENGTYNIGTYTIHDTHPYDWLSINQIIKFSSNIGAAKISETIGDRALYNTLVSFGFGSKTEVGSPGETSGNLLSYRKWSRIDAGAISFGQGISVSAVQLISGISAIANNGKRMKPMLIKKVLSNSGEVLREYHPEILRRVISPKTAQQVKHMMSLVVSKEGTGTKAAMDGYTVCGKTGTAQKASTNKRGYAKNKYISVFAGFAPLENPELAILVVVDEPTKQYYGGDVAAPAFKTIMTESFSYLNIPPKKASSMIALATTGENN